MLVSGRVIGGTVGDVFITQLAGKIPLIGYKKSPCQVGDYMLPNYYLLREPGNSIDLLFWGEVMSDGPRHFPVVPCMFCQVVTGSECAVERLDTFDGGEEIKDFSFPKQHMQHSITSSSLKFPGFGRLHPMSQLQGPAGSKLSRFSFASGVSLGKCRDPMCRHSQKALVV